MLAWDRRLERWQAAHRAAVLNPVFEGFSYAGTYGAVWLVPGSAEWAVTSQCWSVPLQVVLPPGDAAAGPVDANITMIAIAAIGLPTILNFSTTAPSRP